MLKALTQFALPLALCAGISAQQRAYLVDTSVSTLYTVDLATGAATSLTTVTGAGTAAGLTWRTDTNELWSIDLGTGKLGTIDTTSGVFNGRFTANPTTGWQGVTWDPKSRLWYLANQNGSNYSLDPSTGLTALLGASGYGLITALETDNNGVVYGIDFSTGRLGTMDKLTGAMTTIGAPVTPFNMQGLAFDQFGQLYGSNTTSDSLYKIDKVLGGAATLVGAHGSGVSFSKGFEIVDPVAYAVDSNLDQLYTIDLLSGAATLIASTNNNGLATPAGLAWRNDTGELWTIDLSGGEVGTIDTWTGTFTSKFIANPTAGWQDIAWDPVTSKFYLANQNGSNYVADPLTGTTTLLGVAGANFTLITGSAVDRLGNLWGADFSGRLGKTDRTTGVTTLVSTSTTANFQSLAFTRANRGYAIDTSGTQELWTVNPNTGTAVLIGALGAGTSFIKGFTIVATGSTGSATTSGTGCADFGSVTLALDAFGTPSIGDTISVGTALSTQTSFWSLFAGGSNTLYGSIPLPFDLGLLNAPGCKVYCDWTVLVGSFTPAQRAVLPIPATPSLIGGVIYFQSVVVDPRINSLGLASSDLLTVRIGQEI